MITLTPGKVRALQTTSTGDGVFKILAIDHRDSLRVLIDPDDPASVPSDRLTELKLAIVDHIAPHATAVMLEPEYCAAQAIVAGVMPGSVGFLSALEEQGYLGDPFARQTSLLNGWSVSKAKRLGASGIKLLLFYHPDAGESAERQESVVRAVIADCEREDIPLFLEPMSYSLDPSVSVKSSEFARQRRHVVVEGARRLGAIGPDILKLQFPIDADHEPNERIWEEACLELHEAAAVPWALLSSGDRYEVFKTQLGIACRAGCSGFMVGRALWREAISATGADRNAVLEDIVLSRFKELSVIADSYGRNWKERHAPPTTIDDSWFRQY